ncbi:Fic family protein [Patescibacteria group bacterium]|nr:Fic family protein [Patescibacteria group bacterium]
MNDFQFIFDFFEKYDRNKIENNYLSDIKDCKLITYHEFKYFIGEIREEYNFSELFGKEKDETLKSTFEAINQQVFGNFIYPSIEEKAANLLYKMVKNHHFIDGNKRISAFIFLYFLEKNDFLYYKNRKRIDDKALILLILWIIETSESKDIVIKLIINFLI